jgi:hypothetical protein
MVTQDCNADQQRQRSAVAAAATAISAFRSHRLVPCAILSLTVRRSCNLAIVQLAKNPALAKACVCVPVDHPSGMQFANVEQVHSVDLNLPGDGQ